MALEQYQKLSSICLIVILLSGCAAIRETHSPKGVGLGNATPVDKIINKSAWLSKVYINDYAASDKDAFEESFTLSVLGYIQDAKYFRDVHLLIGKVPENDLILRFQFDKYQIERSRHPADIPAAIFTLGLCRLFGTPVWIDKTEISGKLIIEDFSGKLLTEVKSKVDEEHNLGLHEYSHQSGIEASTRLMKELLDKACDNIR